MSDENIIFNPDNKGWDKSKYYNIAPKSKLAKWLIKISGGKLDETKANYVMLVILGIIILATIIVVISNFGGMGDGDTKNFPASATPNKTDQNAIPTPR